MPDMETYPPPRRRSVVGRCRGGRTRNGREVRRRAATARAGGVPGSTMVAGQHCSLQCTTSIGISPRGITHAPKDHSDPQRFGASSVRSSSSSSSSPRAEAARLHIMHRQWRPSKKRLEHILDENRLKIGTVRQVIDSESRSSEGMINSIIITSFFSSSSSWHQRITNSPAAAWQQNSR